MRACTPTCAITQPQNQKPPTSSSFPSLFGHSIRILSGLNLLKGILYTLFWEYPIYFARKSDNGFIGVTVNMCDQGKRVFPKNFRESTDSLNWSGIYVFPN